MSVSQEGSVGLSACVPVADDVNVPAGTSTIIVELTLASEAARSGVLKWIYSVNVSVSRYSPRSPPSKSYTVMEINSSEGSGNDAAICGQL